MENRNIIILIMAALAVGLIAGLLGPKFFNGKPGAVTVKQTGGVPAAQAPSHDYSLQIGELMRRLEANPNDVDLLIQLGNTYFDGNMYPESIEAYLKALALKPGNPDVLTDLGVMYRRNGQPEEAVMRFREAMEIAHDHAQSRFNLGIVQYYDFADVTAAREAFTDFLRIVPSGQQADAVRGLMASMQQPASQVQ